MKGSVLKVAKVTLVIVMSMTLIGLTTDTVSSTSELIKSESTGIVAKRISNSAAMIDSLNESKVSMNLSGEYGFTEESGDTYINYSVGGFALNVLEEDSKEKISNTVGFNLVNEGWSRKLCLRKNSGSNVRIELGGC